MTSYEVSRFFTQKSAKSRKIFDLTAGDDAKYFEQLKHKKYQPDPKETHKMYEDWSQLMFEANINIAVYGFGSTQCLLDTYKLLYLDASNKIPDHAIMNTRRVDAKNAYHKIVSVRLGRTPVSVEAFCHKLMNLNRASRKDLQAYGAEAKKHRSHVVFLINSYEVTYRESPKVCDMIFELCLMFPANFHFILTVDHVHWALLLNNDTRALHRVVLFKQSTAIPFSYEVAMSVGLDEKADVYDAVTSLESLRNVYSALQMNCRKVLIYLLAESIERPDEVMSFTEIFNYVSRQHMIYDKTAVQHHLGELLDHEIVEYNRNRVTVKITPQVAQKFLEGLKDELHD